MGRGDNRGLLTKFTKLHTMGTELKHIPYLDGWRGVAILLVLFGHFFDLPASRLGVEVFFVLSGMLMSRVLFDAKLSLVTFYRRRCARILPAYFLFLATMFVVAALALPPIAAGQFFYNAVFLASYMPTDIVRGLLPLTHLWSLNVEEHSYIFLSLIALVSRTPRIVRTALTAAALACVGNYVVYAQMPGGSDVSIFRTECAAFPLLASAALHLWLKNLSRASALVLLIGACVGVVACVVVSRKIGGLMAMDYVAKPLCVALVLNTLSAAPALAHRALSMPWLRWFGVCSYSLYLWHPPVQELAMAMNLPRWIALAAAVALGAASFYLFEDPLRKYIRDRRQVPLAPVARSL